MNLSTIINETVAEHPDSSAEHVANLVYARVTKLDLFPLLVEEVEHQQRAQVRRNERSITADRIGLLLSRSESASSPPEGSADQNQMMLLLRRTWKLGNGSEVEIGKATVEEIDERLTMLRKQRSGLDQTIAGLEEVRAVLVRTGARCLDDLLPGAA